VKHSPAPWFRHGQKDDPCGSAIIRAANGFEVANSRSFLIEEYEANANLIAAAPELLAACKAAMRILALWGGNDCPQDSHLFEENRALFMMQNAFEMAIAKAEGCHQTFDCNAGDHSDACPAQK
jgi:hypothetical protein